ncbi:ATP-grasp domain-containing protein [Dactylosporangium sp. NPDC006015]|uniref:ATP-grasp domain-containing protein n=1 Tax=Dactylosporangium sp. NPDC006015 TaxID=3154576 RepID=UPI0033A9A573
MTDFLVLPPRLDATARLLAAAARRRGLPVAQGPHELRGAGHVYGGPVFAGEVAAALDLALLDPADDWLVTLPYRYTCRDIVMSTVGDARWTRTPVFVKQPRDKDLPATVYADGSRLPALAADTPVLVSGIVSFLVEYRLFVLDGVVHAGSRYATHGRLDPAPLDGCRDRDAVLEFAGGLLGACAGGLPSAVVVDVGLASDADRGEERWAVVEANMGWFSACYAADPDRVLDVVLRAAGPRDRLLPRDAPFDRAVS